MRQALGTIRVFTFKEGVLSAVAHDLCLRLVSFELTLDGTDVRAELDLQSLLVEGPMQNGVLHAEQYDAGKRAEISQAMRGVVLHTDRHPKATFTGSAVATEAGYRVDGRLLLVGKTQPLAFDVQRDAGTYRASFELQPSRWGIAQYKALLGAIRLKDVLKVELALTEGVSAK